MSFFEKLAERLELDTFDRRHKKAFVFLACAMIGVIVLWVWQLQNNIINPLYGGLNPKDLPNTTANQSVAEDAQLKNQDTDKDGLSDWDELNIYKTSPYLDDSDSDGLKDYDEISKGSDPNCPVGQQCNEINNQITNSADQALSDFINQPVTETNTPSTSSNDDDSLTDEEKNALKKVLGSSNDPQLLRDFLLESGADKEYVNSLSDEDLQKVINEILK